MAATDRISVRSIWKFYSAATVLFSIILFSLYTFDTAFTGSFYSRIYFPAAILLIVSFVVFTRYKDMPEAAFLLFYCLWVTVLFVTRAVLDTDAYWYSSVNRWMCLPYAGFAMIPSREKRMLVAEIWAGVYAFAYTALACVGLCAAFTARPVFLPLYSVTVFAGVFSGRLYLMDVSCNTCSLWLAISLFCVIFLLMRSRRVWVRPILAAAGLVDLAALALTYSRSAQLGTAVGVGILVSWLLLRRFSGSGVIKKALIIVLSAGLAAAVTYKSFSLCSELIIRASLNNTSAEDVADLTEDPAMDALEISDMLGSRGMNSSGRVELWGYALKAAAEEPLTFLFGDQDAILRTNSYIAAHSPGEHAHFGPRAHHHNSFLDILLVYGIPAFLAFMLFVGFLAVKMLRVYFSSASAQAVLFTALTAALLIYNLFETSLFDGRDIRFIFFFVSAGYVLAEAKDLKAPYTYIQ